MILRDIAHTRSGDKGDTSNISVIAFALADFALLRREVTVEKVRAILGGMVQGEIERYELPGLGALNFVLHRALAGGVTRSLALDIHGKSLGSLLLSMPIGDSDCA
ncbi:MAG TPA: hypothetical protein VHC39_00685 [Rhizomicrobium sp.]|nr:hypothetical protein [Rhizomicrobium sp.]